MTSQTHPHSPKMVSKVTLVGVLSVLVVLQFIGFVYLYTKPRTGTGNSEGVRYVLISKSLNLARRTLGLKGSESPPPPRPSSPARPSQDVVRKKDTGSDRNNTSQSNTIEKPRPFPVVSNNSSIRPDVSSKSPKAMTADQLSKPKSLRTWKSNTFCHEFLVDTFHDSIPVCDSIFKPSDSIKCYGNSHSKHMARCELENVAIRPAKLSEAMFDADSVKLSGKDDVVRLLNDKGTSCPKPTSQKVDSFMEDGDYIRLLVDKVAKEKQVTSSVCEKFIDKTAFFFTGHPFHIYFRFLDYYNLHKALNDYDLNENEYDIIRVSTGVGEYHHKEFEKLLYPNMIHISDLPDVVTCYKRVVLIPKSYASTPFQCKMHWNLDDHCMKCNGRGLSDTDFQTFRKRVVESCSLDDNKHQKDQRLVLISRKPYKREPKDKVQKFERVLTNEEDLVKGIKTTFPSTNVTIAHLEDLPLCEQVLYANQADVLLAVHGAGLVHLWWLREEALAIEMEPHYEAGNPSFKVLARLTGRNYFSHFIGGGWGMVNVDVDGMLKVLSSHGNLH